MMYMMLAFSEAAGAAGATRVAAFFRLCVILMIVGIVCGLGHHMSRGAAGTPKFDAEVERRVEKRVEETIEEDPVLKETYKAYREEDFGDDGVHRSFRDD